MLRKRVGTNEACAIVRKCAADQFSGCNGCDSPVPIGRGNTIRNFHFPVRIGRASVAAETYDHARRIKNDKMRPPAGQGRVGTQLVAGNQHGAGEVRPIRSYCRPEALLEGFGVFDCQLKQRKITRYEKNLHRVIPRIYAIENADRVVLPRWGRKNAHRSPVWLIMEQAPVTIKILTGFCGRCCLPDTTKPESSTDPGHSPQPPLCSLLQPLLP